MYSILPLFISLYSLITGIFVLKSNNQNWQNITFSFFCFCTFAWQLFWAILFQINSYELAINIVKLGYLFIIFLPTFMYHFLIKVSNYNYLSDKIILRISYLLCIIFALTLPSSYFVEGAYKYFWGYYPDAGILHPFHVTQTCLVVTKGLLLVLKKFLKCNNNIVKKRLILVLLGLFIYFFAAIDYLCNYGFEFYPPGILFIFICLNLIAFSILKYEMMEISLILRKNISTLITALLIISTFGFVLILTFKINYFIHYLSLVTLCLFWGVKGNTVSNYLITTAQKKFIKGFIEYNSVILKISSQLNSTINIQTINTIITKNLKDEIEVKEIQFLLPNNFFNSSEPFTAYQNLSKHSILKSVTAQSDLVKNLIESKQIIYINNSEKLSDELPELNVFELIVPLFYKGDLIGILTVGPKLNEDKFSKKDIEFFQALAINLSSVLQLSKPFEEIKENYKKSLEAAEVLAEQAAYATLCKGIAHEINNPLGILKAGAERLQANPDDSNRRDRCLRMIIGNVNRLSNITQLMLTYGKLNNVSLHSNVLLKSTIEDLLELVQHQPNINKKITFTSDIHSEKTITADADKLYQVLLNITLNAIEAIDEKGQIHISLTDQTVTGLNGNEYEGVEICISDTGKGMDESTRSQIFETFFTTKHDNTGLGLATSKTIINEHNGTIQVKSEPGKGTQFIIQLPSNN